jgi:hypothetical protein
MATIAALVVPTAASKESFSDVLFVCGQQQWDAPRPSNTARAGVADGCWLLSAWPALAGALACAIDSGSSGDLQRGERCADVVDMAEELLLFPLKVLSPTLIGAGLE